jgi:hypothetical protein
MTADETIEQAAQAGFSDDDRWYLNDEREFLHRSLDDARREHEAGDLTDEDFEVLSARDHKRLSDVEAELAALGPAHHDPVDDADTETDTERADAAEGAEASARPLTRRMAFRRVGIIAAVFLIIAGAVILVDHAINPRLPGQASSGGITQTKQQLIEQQLSEALTLNNGGKVDQALSLYAKVLGEDPDDPQALAATGWLEWNYGTAGDSPTLEASGRKNEEKAVRVAPSFYGGHLFLGLIELNQDHNATGAVAQFNDFLVDNPPPGQITADASLLRVAYTEAGVPVPALLAATTTTTSAP